MEYPVFSIVTPTYNRANLIHRVFDSLMEQTYKDFEWIVIDDGSTDDTESVISTMKKNANFNIKYIKTRNQGKANALNESLKHCEGKLYLVFDSDDWCDDNALEVFLTEYNTLSDSEINSYMGLSCLKRCKNNKIVGDNYSNLDKYGKSYIDRVNMNIKGDKWECLFTDRVKNHKYPVHNNEKYMAPGYLWLKISEQGYKTVFIDTALSTIEYQADGISQNNLKHRISSLETTITYYKDVYRIEALNYNKSGRYYANYIRFSLHAKRKVSFLSRYLPFGLTGVLLYSLDNLKIK